MGEEHFKARVMGMCAFVHMIDPVKGAALLKEWSEIQQTDSSNDLGS
jgi:hypothetical protein